MRHEQLSFCRLQGSEGQRDDSESLFLTSTDDEIAVYDRPGPDNILEQDKHLTIAEQVSSSFRLK